MSNAQEQLLEPAAWPSSGDVVSSVARLAVLHGLDIIDTPPEPAYDDLAALAAAVCGSQIGAVNFVDEARHWTKAIVGVKDGQGASVPADVSLCAATIRSEQGVLTVGDTLADDLWREHPFVVGKPGLRFYAGASIIVSSQPIGVVCVFGDQPREFSPAQQASLGVLARQASAHLELRERNARLQALAISDSLTGLANRTLLVDRLHRALARCEGLEDSVGVLFCDVDTFKSVNDRFGHQAGDRLLCDIADQLRAAVRNADTVARIAGDEFVIVCPGLSDRETLEAIVQAVAACVGRIEPMPDGSAAPRLSVGAVLARPGELAADVMSRADAAMYRAKSTA